MVKTVLSVAMTMLLAGCGSQEVSDSVCSPGASQTCACPGGSSGFQRCNSIGSGWGICGGCTTSKKDSGSGTCGACSSRELCENGKCISTRQYKGLMWQVVASARTYSWSGAKSFCQTLSLGGYSNWRLPTIEELRLLIYKCPPTITGGTCPVVTCSTFNQDKCAVSPYTVCNNSGPNYEKCSNDEWSYMEPKLWKHNCEPSHWSSTFCSSSTPGWNADVAFAVHFSKGLVNYALLDKKLSARCVRP